MYVKYIVVRLCILLENIFYWGYFYYNEKLSWGVMCIMGNIMGVRPADRSEAAKKPHRGCWVASSRLMISLFEADEKPHGRAHDHGEARIKPHRGCSEASCSGT